MNIALRDRADWAIHVSADQDGVASERDDLTNDLSLDELKSRDVPGADDNILCRTRTRENSQPRARDKQANTEQTHLKFHLRDI